MTSRQRIAKLTRITNSKKHSAEYKTTLCQLNLYARELEHALYDVTQIFEEAEAGEAIWTHPLNEVTAIRIRTLCKRITEHKVKFETWQDMNEATPVYKTPTAAYFATLQGANVYAEILGLNNDDRAIEYCTAYYDNMGETFRYHCNLRNLNGLNRLTMRDGSQLP